MEQDWVKIYSTNYEHRANFVKGLLEGAGIDCVLVNKKDSAYLFGEIEVYVYADMAIMAKDKIKEIPV